MADRTPTGYIRSAIGYLEAAQDLLGYVSGPYDGPPVQASLNSIEMALENLRLAPSAPEDEN